MARLLAILYPHVRTRGLGLLGTEIGFRLKPLRLDDPLQNRSHHRHRHRIPRLFSDRGVGSNDLERIRETLQAQEFPGRGPAFAVYEKIIVGSPRAQSAREWVARNISCLIFVPNRGLKFGLVIGVAF